ncbi:unnamed protein product [Musa acuminata subsp. burmannicoides]
MFIKELVRSSPAAQPLHMNLNPKFEQRRFLNSSPSLSKFELGPICLSGSSKR